MPLSFHPRVWLNPILPPMPGLLRQILESALASEVEAVRSILQAQIANINFVQSHSQQREWFFYRIEKGIRRVPVGLALCLPEKEMLWATIRIICRDKQLISNVWILNGRVGSISFDQPCSRRRLIQPKFEIINIYSLRSNDVQAASWHEFLPNDLQEFAADKLTDGVVFLEPRDTYLVETSRATCAMIGEIIDKGALLVSVEDDNIKGIYFCAYDGDDFSFLGADCLSAVERIKSDYEYNNRI